MILANPRSFAVAVTLALGGTVAGSAAVSLAAPAATSTTVTRSTFQTTNVRTSPATSSVLVGKMPVGTTVTGTLSNGWVKISTPSKYAGKYVKDSVLAKTTATAPPAKKPSLSAPTGTPAWVGYAKTYLYNSAGAQLTTIPVNTKVTGKIAGTKLFKITGGPYNGKYLRNIDLLWTGPLRSGPTALGTNKAPVGITVTRYVITNRDPIAVRSAATTHSKLVAYIPKGTALKGKYVSDDWFRITSGAHTGRYVSSALIYATNTMSAYNGVAKKNDMCALPSWTQTNWAPTQPRFLACPAAKSFVEMNAAFRAQYGYDIKIDEAYRDLTTQQKYAGFLGYPRAARPGTSNHGMGVAIDLETRSSSAMSGTPYRSGFGGPYDTWITAHGKEYGWDRPAYLDRNGSNPESWHYNFIG